MLFTQTEDNDFTDLFKPNTGRQTFEKDCERLNIQYLIRLIKTQICRT